MEAEGTEDASGLDSPKEQWQVVSKVGGWYLEENVPWPRWQRQFGERMSEVN